MLDINKPVTGTLIDPYDYKSNKSRKNVGRFIHLQMDKGQAGSKLLYPYFGPKLPYGFRGTFVLRVVTSPLSPSRKTIAAVHVGNP